MTADERKAARERCSPVSRNWELFRSSSSAGSTMIRVKTDWCLPMWWGSGKNMRVDSPPTMLRFGSREWPYSDDGSGAIAAPFQQSFDQELADLTFIAHSRSDLPKALAHMDESDKLLLEVWNNALKDLVSEETAHRLGDYLRAQALIEP